MALPLGMILLNPGPVNLSAGVREALAGPDLCHREPEFGELQASVRQELLDVYGLSPEDWAAILLCGSGTAAVEALLTSLAPRDHGLLIVENGVYGERMTCIARTHGIAHHAVRYAWRAAIRVNDVEKALAAGSDISHIAVVHHETTTGRLNDLPALSELCRARGVQLLVDAVSSFGAEPLDFASEGITGVAGTANKCLHGAPGVSFAVVRRGALQASDPRTLYLDLASYCRDQDRNSTPFTQPVQILYALRQALTEMRSQGGWRARHERYRSLAQQVRAGLLTLGIKPLLQERETSVVLSAYHLPTGVSYPELHDALKEHGFVIYAGQGALARNIFRVSTMGAITDTDIDRFVRAFQTVVQSRS